MHFFLELMLLSKMSFSVFARIAHQFEANCSSHQTDPPDLTAVSEKSDLTGTAKHTRNFTNKNKAIFCNIYLSSICCHLRAIRTNGFLKSCKCEISNVSFICLGSLELCHGILHMETSNICPLSLSQWTSQDNKMIPWDEVRVILKKVALFINSTSNVLEANFPRQYHPIPKSSQVFGPLSSGSKCENMLRCPRMS